MYQLLTTQQQVSAQRGDVLRREMSTAITSSSKEASGVTTQVSHFVSTVRVLEEQISTNQDFSTDAFQQIRDEFR